MSPAPDPALPTPALAGFPPEVREAFQRYRTKGDRQAAETVVIAAAVDYRPASASLTHSVTDETRLLEDLLAVRTIADLRGCVMRKLAGKTGTA
jgi:hypothetical protein